MSTIVQGTLAGFTAAHLKESKDINQCTKISLQINHALLLIAETLHFANCPLGAFGTVVKIACAVIPLAIVADYNIGKQILTKKQMENLSTVYQTAIVATSVATLALGNPLFAVTSLSVLAIDAYKGNENQCINAAKRVGAFLALIGYGAQAFAEETFLAGMNVLSAMIICLDSFSKTVDQTPSENSNTKCKYVSYPSYNLRAEQIWNIMKGTAGLCRTSIWVKN